MTAYLILPYSEFIRTPTAMTDLDLLARSINPYVDYAKYVRMLDKWDASDETKLEMVKQLEVVVQSALDVYSLTA